MRRSSNTIIQSDFRAKGGKVGRLLITDDVLSTMK